MKRKFVYSPLSLCFEAALEALADLAELDELAELAELSELAELAELALETALLARVPKQKEIVNFDKNLINFTL